MTLPRHQTRVSGSSSVMRVCPCMAETMIRTDAGDIWADDSGGDLPPLFVLHPGIGDSRIWNPIMPALLTTYRVIRFDARSFGKSPVPSRDFSLLGDAVKVMDHFGVQRAAVVGSSIGGSTALSLALDEPTRVSALVIALPRRIRLRVAGRVARGRRIRRGGEARRRRRGRGMGGQNLGRGRLDARSRRTTALGGDRLVAAISHTAITGVDAQTGMLLGCHQGEMAVLFTTLETHTAITACINGTDARIEIDGDFLAPARFRLIDRDGQIDVYDIPHEGRGLRHQVTEVGRCLRAGLTESPVLPPSETQSIMETLDEIRRQIGLSYPTDGFVDFLAPSAPTR